MTAAPGRRTRAAVVDERKVSRVMTVCLDAMTARADVEVCIAVVHGLCHVEVPGQLLVELVPVLRGVHVGLVVAKLERVEVVLSTRIALRGRCVCPAHCDNVPAIVE